jgi:ABC-type dipeptide/oligopeptide/nickel transport system permease subunit
VVTKPFVEAAQVAGGSVRHVLIRHIVPHMAAMAFLQMLLVAVVAVIMDGYLSFSSATRYTLNWGTMLSQNEMLQEVLGEGTQWFSVLPPVLAFTLFGLAFYLVSRGVQEVADPKLRPI